MRKIEYFIECLADSFCRNNIIVTPEQIKNIANDVLNGFDCMDQAFPVPDLTPSKSETEKLRDELLKEKSKVTCEHCQGRGGHQVSGPYHSSYHPCFKCNGEGRHLL